MLDEKLNVSQTYSDTTIFPIVLKQYFSDLGTEFLQPFTKHAMYVPRMQVFLCREPWLIMGQCNLQDSTLEESSTNFKLADCSFPFM